MSKQKAVIAPIFLRIKAFILDLFLIATPILYFTTYVILNGKDDFQKNQLAIFIVWLIFAIICGIFYSKSAQTPGYKSQNIFLVDSRTGRKISFLKSIFRFFLFIISGASIIGLIMCFFRKDKKNLHDILSQSMPVIKKL